jgi:hypothetical protein
MNYSDLLQKTSNGGSYSVTFKKLNGEMRTLNGTRPNLTSDERSAIGYDLQATGNVIFKDAEINDFRAVKAANVVTVTQI